MKGARALLWPKTIRIPNNSSKVTIGMTHHFLYFLMNSKYCPTICHLLIEALLWVELYHYKFKMMQWCSSFWKVAAFAALARASGPTKRSRLAHAQKSILPFYHFKSKVVLKGDTTLVKLFVINPLVLVSGYPVGFDIGPVTEVHKPFTDDLGGKAQGHHDQTEYAVKDNP